MPDDEKTDAPAAAQEPVIAEAQPIPTWKSVVLLVLAAIWSPVSQLMLSPSHGSIPASTYHSMLTSNISVLTVPLDAVILAILPFKEKRFILPLLAFAIPPIYYILTPTANYIGPAYSAALLEMFGSVLLTAFTFNVAWPGLKPLIPASIEEPYKTFAPPVVAFAIFKAAEMGAGRALPLLVGSSIVFTRQVLPAILALCTAALLPSEWLLYAALPVFHTLSLNAHTPLPIPLAGLKDSLKLENYTLLAREESVTGYLSVLQNEKEGFRVMRCDHSLLGGEWVYGVGKWPGGEGFHDRRAVVGEPVYSVFAMLEAVRLVRTVEDGKLKPIKKEDRIWNALVIGLGIGTTPAAFTAHGINTTVVELDPVVYKLAREYFALPPNHTAVIQDATEYVKYANGNFDYIIHDVFTGGVEPADLFTVEFIQRLHDLLKPKGVIAINYAGDVRSPPTSLTVRTILSVFPNCRLFREHPAEDDAESDFTNMIFYCRKGNKPFAFREPVETDYLGTMARKHTLVPKHEMDLQSFDKDGASTKMPDVLTSKNTKALAQWRHLSAAGHWKVMRTVLPPVVWERW